MSTTNSGEFEFRMIFKKETGLQYVALPDILEYLKTVRSGLTSDEMATTREVLSDIITNLATIRTEKA